MPLIEGAAQLFERRDFGGSTAVLTEGAYNLDYSDNVVGNDTVMSLRINPDYVVTVYTAANGGGDSKVFTADTPFVGESLIGKISSVRVAKLIQARAQGDYPYTLYKLYPMNPGVAEALLNRDPSAPRPVYDPKAPRV
ncbi:hypothetical protein ACFQL8_37375 [Streptomyces goshikiensis]|uniref:hypothetical protein n=1 Tax=Streptomyces goshikiensis TaxID=1942 RepID=UPI0016722685|nr:hypothetical protein [Streptomyces goshikiensis]GHD80177.1 hypothetical protein GCM10010336_63470 [Streptomyces goshikiensis]